MDKYVKRNELGAVDIEASVQAYTEALKNWVAKNEFDSVRIEQAVESVFDKYPGRLVMSALIDFSVKDIDSSPEKFTSLSDHVTKYIRGQAKLGRLDIGKGRGKPGVARLARPGEPIPAKPEK